jgi:hypothetical protein
MDPNDDNHANQMNPEHDAYWQSRGEDGRPEDADDDNRANQLNPNNDAYWQSRGQDGR